ncbi:hypothetical protein H310_13411 [Aphanomyces invadans]|uniref:WW domain-containing protein n=1 Tax=Aphanomyces invadans TaxID=157072 RepID=A0A024TFM6_9STRA|nr:hypothetical protein H310_13411 [Aphanomyces invadans]ETV92162.1 hypothetical protein H310_13411 [Aphanomyces invadans]|eukprot:XP_008879126.1 hypothetical protein H310_13411 [Aphanomyces invadans]
MSWDLSHLGAKYPWLQVNASTLEEFRAPFDWSKKATPGCREEDDKSTKKSSPPSRHRRHKPHHKAMPSHTTARQVLLMNTRDHLTDAVVLQRYEQSSVQLRQTKSMVNVLEPREPTSPSSTKHEVEAPPPPLATLRVGTQVTTVPCTLQRTKGPTASLFIASTTCHKAAPTPSHVHPRTFASPPSHHSAAQTSTKKRSMHKDHPAATHPGGLLQPYAAPSAQSFQPSQYHHRSDNTNSAAMLAKQSQDLHDALAKVKSDELALLKSVDETIEAQRATIPLQFLFERNMSAYCIEKGVETILHVFSTLQAKYLCQGFTRWHQVTTALRKAEIRRATEQRVRANAIALFNRVAGDCLMGNTKRALHRWHRAVQRMVADERNAAATTIQKHVKRRRDARFVQQLREERAASDARNAARILQLLALEASGRKQLWIIREHAGRIRERRAYEAKMREEAALSIQRTYRGFRGRVHVQNLRRLVADAFAVAEAIKQAALQSLRKNSTFIQSIVRMFLVRLRLHNQRMLDAIRSDNALTIQRAWRTKKGKKVMASRFAKRKMSMEEIAEREAFMARQRFYAEMEKKRQASAIVMQRRIRGYLARKHVRLMRNARRLDHAARRMQAAWRKSKGRVTRLKADLVKEALREVYRRERVALEDKKKWVEQLDMEQYKADTVLRKERERKLQIAQQEEEIARLDAQTNAYKLQALEAQKTLKAAQLAAWKPMNDGFGNIFYSNELTGETTWDVPDVLLPKVQLVEREEDWEELYNPHTGQIYKHNRVTGAVKMNEGLIHCGICFQCDNRASYHCSTCESGFQFTCEKCFASTHATSEYTAHNTTHFRPGSALCSQCNKMVALRGCPECQDKFCVECFGLTHAKGKKKTHVPNVLNVVKMPLGDDTDAYCTECDVELCTKLCNLCGDGFCDSCFATLHAKGRKAEHTYVAWKEITQAGDWIEIYEGKIPMYYNIVTKEGSAEKPSVLLLGVERHRDMIAEKVRERKKAEGEKESELVSLREQVKALEEAAELARRQKQELELLNENPQVLAKPLKKKWWKSKAQLARENAERENQVVLSLMLTKQRQEQLHRQAMEIGSKEYANSIVADIVQAE